MSFKKIIILFVFILFFQFIYISPVSAVNEGGIMFTPSVPIPGLDVPERGIEIKGDFSTLTEYISKFYKFAIGLAGILSVIMLTIAGLMWLTAGGSASQIGKAKQMIGGSLTGLVLILLSYTILYTINPDIVALKLPPSITTIGKIEKGCSWQKTACEDKQYEADSNSLCGDKTSSNDKYCCCYTFSITEETAKKICSSRGNDWFIADSFDWKGSGSFNVLAGDPSTQTQNICNDKCNSTNAGASTISAGDDKFYACCSCDNKKSNQGSRCLNNGSCDPGLTCWDFGAGDKTCQKCFGGGASCAVDSQCCSGICSGWQNKECEPRLASGEACSPQGNGSECVTGKCVNVLDDSGIPWQCL